MESSAPPPSPAYVQQLESLVGVVQELSEARELARVQEVVRRAARDLTGADGATFILREGESCFYVDEDAIEPLWKGRRFPMDECISGWVMSQRTPVVIEDVYRDERVPHAAYRPTFVKSLAVVPIRASDPIGAIGSYWATPHRASVEQLKLLQALADSTAIAIQNVRLAEELGSARDAAESLGRLKDEFLATVSHELRSPLNTIVGWSNLLVQHDLTDDEQQHAAATILRSAQLQAQLINDLLDASSIVSGQLQLGQEEVDLVELVASSLEAVTASAEEKSLRIEHDFACAATVRGDEARLRQVVASLLSNAVKFTPRGGSLRVSLARSGERVELSVRDTGEGIEPAFLPHLFDRFRQADGAITRRAGGLGLGLAIVRHLVELHGGTVSAVSEGRGRGATFTVALPLHPRHGARASARPAPRSGGRRRAEFELSGVRVLLVDDDADTRDLLRRVVTASGAEVHASGSAGEGLAALRSFQPHVLVSDIGMPFEDGYSLMRRIRALEHTQRLPRLPAMALTAHALDVERGQAAAAGFDAHLAKPADPRELLATIARLTRR